jgi:fucose 4-O-acetylase-like acetyltransferase
MGRLTHFDIAKAIGIILVVIGHYYPCSSPEWYVKLREWIYSFHMPLFLFASGYIYIAFKKEEKYIDFILKKIKRLMLPYLATSFIIITIKLFTQNGMYVENPVTAFSYLRMFYYPEAGYFLWFIWALFLMFCVVPFFKNKIHRLGLFVVALIIHFCPTSELSEVFCIRETLSMMVWFLFGVVCFDFKEDMDKKIGSKKLCGIAAVLFVVSSIMKYGIHLSNDYILLFATHILPWTGIAFVLYVSNLQTQNIDSMPSNILLNIGSASFFIYLFHTTFMGFAKSFVHRIPFMNGKSDLWFTIGAILVVSVGIVCPILFYRYVLIKTKVTKLLFGIK